jgi:hypothetical protein
MLDPLQQTRPLMEFPLSPEEYKRFCRCWFLYLEKIERDRHFTEDLRSRLPRNIVVRRWPTVWPGVEILFGGVGSFVQAVEGIYGSTTVI